MNETSRTQAALRADILKTTKEQLRLLEACSEASAEKDKQIEILQERIKRLGETITKLTAERDKLDERILDQASIIEQRGKQIEEQASVIENLNKRILELGAQRPEGVKVGEIKINIDGSVGGYHIAAPSANQDLWGVHDLCINTPGAAAEIRQLSQEIKKLMGELSEAKSPKPCCDKPDSCAATCYWRFQKMTVSALDAATASLAEHRARIVDGGQLDPVQINEQTK